MKSAPAASSIRPVTFRVLLLEGAVIISSLCDILPAHHNVFSRRPKRQENTPCSKRRFWTTKRPTGRKDAVYDGVSPSRAVFRSCTENGHVGYRIVLDGTELKIHNVSSRRTFYRRLRPRRLHSKFLTCFCFCFVANNAKYGYRTAKEQRWLYFNYPVIVVHSGICNDIMCYRYQCNLFYRHVFI